MRTSILPLAGLLLAGGTQPALAQPPVKRAVIVGAKKGGPQQPDLRYAHSDAARFLETLTTAGGYDPGAVELLLDPSPEALLGALDSALADDALAEGGSLLFYYSGHATTEALFPDGSPLHLEAVRTRLDNEAASVRLGILDACQGQGWTGAKGLSMEDAIPLPAHGNTWGEGTVLFASSSGAEDAHESDRTKGSYFTHHLTVGMRGAADVDQDGAVTVHEAFEYARLGTLRESSVHSGTLQHPSFYSQYSGRSTLVLTRPGEGSTHLRLSQQDGPLEVIDLTHGVSLLRLENGAREVELSLNPGRYVIKKEVRGEVYALEQRLEAGQSLLVNEAALPLSQEANLASKHPIQYSPAAATTVPDGTIELRLGAGRTHQSQALGSSLQVNPSSFTSPSAELTWGLTDRLSWRVGTPAFAYRFGDRGGFEAVPWGGLLGWGFAIANGTSIGYSGQVGLGVSTRLWLGDLQSIDATASMTAMLGTLSEHQGHASATLGYSRHFSQFSLNLGVGVGYRSSLEGMGTAVENFASSENGTMGISIGSVQNRGLRNVPLIQLHVTDKLSIDGHASLHLSPDAESLQESYRIGITRTF